MAVVEYKKEGRIAIFTLNRPEAFNAFNVQQARELTEAMEKFRDEMEAFASRSD